MPENLSRADLLTTFIAPLRYINNYYFKRIIKFKLEISVSITYIYRMKKDIIRRKEVQLPDSVLDRLALAANRKKWSLKKYMEQVLTDKAKISKSSINFGSEQCELK